MTKTEQAKKKIEEAQTLLDEARKELEQAGNGFWVPKPGDSYGYVTSCFVEARTTWSGNNIDSNRLRENNIFKPGPDCERFIRIKSKLYEIAGDVDYDQDLFHIFFDKKDRKFISNRSCFTIVYGNICSNDPNFFKNAVNQIGEADLKWFYSYGWRRV